jgi:type 1 glutamine amidotransferase
MLGRSEPGAVACWIILLGLGYAHPGRAADAPVRTLIVAGEWVPNWRETTPALRKLLESTGRFDVRVCEVPVGLTARSLEDFDLVVDNGADPDARPLLAAFVAAGKGLLNTRGVHGGPRVEKLSSAVLLDVEITRPDHPVTSGLPAHFRVVDELPHVLSAPKGAVKLAEADGMPVLGVGSHGSGREVTIRLGRDLAAIHEPAFRTLFTRSAEWAATGAVTLPAEAAPQPRPRAIRALLLTGGHDHDASFYGVFRGCPGLDRLPVDTTANALKTDLRGKYDVLILYDFTRELDESRRANLREFVEAGRGVVVLHHALLDFQDWPWWSEQAAGGRYRLRREGDAPSSSVKDNQEIFATPAAAHPILEGLAPFHIRDEAYKNLFMSPNVRPLLTTDNPTSDVNLAWIGPSTSFRVVAIQLGHGPSAFGHPSYRTLVHNAVRWAAGKAP